MRGSAVDVYMIASAHPTLQMLTAYVHKVSIPLGSPGVLEHMHFAL